MKIKRMGKTEILRRIWLFSANKIKSSESFSKQPTQLIIVAHNCHIWRQWIRSSHDTMEAPLTLQFMNLFSHFRSLCTVINHQGSKRGGKTTCTEGLKKSHYGSTKQNTDIGLACAGWLTLCRFFVSWRTKGKDNSSSSSFQYSSSHWETTVLLQSICGQDFETLQRRWIKPRTCWVT